MDNRSVITFIAKRSAEFVILFFVAVTLFFAAYRTAVLSPDTFFIHPHMSPDMQSQLRELWGLDRSFADQYILYVRNILRGDCGVSFYFGEDVSEILKAKTLPALLLTGTAVILALLIDFLLEKKGRSTSAGVLFYLVPFLFIGLLLIAFFSQRLNVFPVGGMKSLELYEQPTSALIRVTDVIHHLVLPCAMMVIWSFFVVSIVKTTIRGIFQEKKALIPPIVMTASAAGVLLLGVIITEIIFSWPGYYKTFLEAALMYDYPLFQGAFIAASLFNLFVVLCIVIVYSLAERTRR